MPPMVPPLSLPPEGAGRLFAEAAPVELLSARDVEVVPVEMRAGLLTPVI